MKINKHRRLTKIIQVLERWAPLESTEVSTHLANLFGVSEDDIKRNVVNDLKFLRDEGELCALYYDKYGNLISEDLEPDDISFYRMKWQLREQIDNRISGSLEINKYQSFITTDSKLESTMRIRQGIGKENEIYHYFYFELNHELYHLNIPKAAFKESNEPYFCLGLTRTSGSYPKELKEDFELFQKTHPGLSCALLSYNDPFISGFDFTAPITIVFHLNGRIALLNKENKNTVETLPLPQGEVSNLLSNLTYFRDSTQTQHWTEIKKEEENTFLEGDLFDLKPPFLFRLKKTSGFILS